MTVRSLPDMRSSVSEVMTIHTCVETASKVALSVVAVEVVDRSLVPLVAGVLTS